MLRLHPSTLSPALVYGWADSLGKHSGLLLPTLKRLRTQSSKPPECLHDPHKGRNTMWLKAVNNVSHVNKTVDCEGNSTKRTEWRRGAETGRAERID